MSQRGEVCRLNAAVQRYVAALDAVRLAESDLFSTWASNIQAYIQ